MHQEFWVKSLRYELEPSEAVKFNKDCLPVEFTNELGAFRLADGELSVTLTPETFDSREHAKEAVRPILEAWNVKTRLENWSAAMNFRYRSSEVEPKIPPPPGDTVVFAEGTSMVLMGSKATLTLTRSSYFAPPTDFRMSPDVETLWARYAQHRSGSEPLPSMAYFISTFLSGCSDDRDYFGASNDVRKTLRRLSSYKGDSLTGRKADAVPLSEQEQRWLLAAVEEVIRRAAQYASGLTPAPLTMAHLPRLE